MNFNFDKVPDNIFFEDAIAKAIIFRASEKAYGVKPNAIGDMRYITVPYSIAWLGSHLKYKLDLYEIWKNQSVSDRFKELIYNIMNKIEAFIKKNAPGSLYGEYAKKEECWNAVKENDFRIDLSVLKAELESSASATKRQRISEDEIAKAAFDESLNRINSVSHQIWKNIEGWGQIDSNLSKYQCDMANTVSTRLRNNRQLTAIEIGNAHKILDIVTVEEPALFYHLDEQNESDAKSAKEKPEITLESIIEIVKWDKKNKALKDFEYRFMADLAEGKKSLTDRNIFIANLNLKKVRRSGFGK